MGEGGEVRTFYFGGEWEKLSEKQKNHSLKFKLYNNYSIIELLNFIKELSLS